MTNVNRVLTEQMGRETQTAIEPLDGFEPFAGVFVKALDGLPLPSEQAFRDAEIAWGIANAAAATTAEKKAFLADDDGKNMGRMIEDLMVAVATGQPLTRASFPAPVWAKINARRAKRGLEPV